ncbi:MAG TPA: thiol:disulfide interchange protein DsbA/DsbL [Steroidobacteraceae bacterium]|nr:thiol:disulfide interchange protein DsbA/DsbL [Steroidobacteraceae bacterium]
MTTISRRELLAFAAGAALTSAAATQALAADAWTEGKHYFRIPQPVPPRPGAVTVTEVFSYGCPACNAFLPYMESLEKKLPAGVTAEYVPAAWVAAENWPLFQRAYLTAKALGVAKQAHAAMFQAIWGPNGELAISDPRTGRLRSPLPSIQDVARFYERVTKVPAAKFVETSKSFSVETDIRRADATIKSYLADSTPTLVVNGKYRFEPRSAGSADQAVALALWLVQQEQRR